MPDEVDSVTDLVQLERDYLANQHQIAENRRRRIEESHRAGPAIYEPQDCIECGESIDMARLRRLPRTRRCQACGKDAELQLKDARDV